MIAFFFGSDVHRSWQALRTSTAQLSMLGRFVALSSKNLPTTCPYLAIAAHLKMDRTRAYVSSASIWEVAIKVALGTLDVDVPQLVTEIARSGFFEVPVLPRHAVFDRSLHDLHRDPLDRILLAQAIYESLKCLTHDRQSRNYSELVGIVWHRRKRRLDYFIGFPGQVFFLKKAASRAKFKKSSSVVASDVFDSRARLGPVLQPGAICRPIAQARRMAVIIDA